VIPAPPVSSKDVTWGFGNTPDRYRIEVWRVPCHGGPDEVALLLRATPLTDAPSVCSSNFNLIQSGMQIDAVIRQTPTAFWFCDDLLVPTTFSLERSSGPPFDPTGAFTLDIDQATSHTMLEVPAGGGTGTPQLGIVVVAAGCTTCQVGQLAQFRVHVTNPGLPILVELKTAIHFPNRSTISILGRHVEDVLESGEFDIPLVGIIVPGDVPKGSYTIEAAILDLDTGVTLSRSSVQASVQ
jgi:hypothetical protein